MATAILPNLVCETDKGLSTVPLVEERAFGLWQKDIPAAYRGLGARELTDRIGAIDGVGTVYGRYSTAPQANPPRNITRPRATASPDSRCPVLPPGPLLPGTVRVVL